MAWINIGDLTINTDVITAIGTEAMWLSNGSRLGFSHYNTSKEQVIKMIEDAERAQRRAMFEENKDEIVDAVATEVVERISEVLNLGKPPKKTSSSPISNFVPPGRGGK